MFISELQIQSQTMRNYFFNLVIENDFCFFLILRCSQTEKVNAQTMHQKHFVVLQSKLSKLYCAARCTAHKYRKRIIAIFSNIVQFSFF